MPGHASFTQISLCTSSLFLLEGSCTLGDEFRSCCVSAYTSKSCWGRVPTNRWHVSLIQGITGTCQGLFFSSLLHYKCNNWYCKSKYRICEYCNKRLLIDKLIHYKLKRCNLIGRNIFTTLCIYESSALITYYLTLTLCNWSNIRI